MSGRMSEICLVKKVFREESFLTVKYPWGNSLRGMSIAMSGGEFWRVFRQGDFHGEYNCSHQVNRRTDSQTCFEWLYTTSSDSELKIYSHTTL